MFKRLIWVILSLLLVVPVMAQDASTPEAAVEAAISAVEAQVGTRAGSFTFQLLGLTSDSSLGCSLIESEELPFEVTAIRVDVVYPDATYVTYSNISGQVVLLCDAKFGEDVMAAQNDAESMCNATPLAALPAYVAPNITLDGVFTATTEPYRVYGISSDGGWYQIASEAGLGWVESTSVTLSGNCDNVPTTAVTNPILESVCFLTPQAAFSNVRSAPNLDGQQVGRIYENEIYQVTARNTAADWFYIEPAGWVSNTVIFTQGDCTNITVNDNAVGAGFADIETGTIDTDAAAILARFECSADFAGYLPPRITIGSGTAQVEAGAVPNTLRAFPSVDDAEAPRLGVIQPQRVIDRVIAGPACNQGFVWWLVEIDDVVGWTAESNQSSDDYFLEPTGDAPAANNVADIDTLDVSTTAIDNMIFSADGSRLFAQTSDTGFGDGTVGAVMIFDLADGSAIARIEEPAGILDMDYATEANLIAVAVGNGTVKLFDAETLELSAQIDNAFDQFGIVNVEITSNAGLVVTSQCGDICEAGAVRTFDVALNQQIQSVTLSDSGVLDIDISADDSTLAVVKTNGVNFHVVNTLENTAVYDNLEGFGIESVVLNTEGTSAYFAGCNNADCTEGRIGLVNAADGSLLGVVPSHSAQASLIALNPNETRFVTVADMSGEIIERNATTGEETQRFMLDLVRVASVAYTPDESRLAIGTTDGRILFEALNP